LQLASAQLKAILERAAPMDKLEIRAMRRHSPLFDIGPQER
jgi:hypothetical protein